MTRNGTSPTNDSGSAHRALPLLFVLALGVLFQGGDWPPATFLIRTGLFLLAARLLFRADAITLRPTAVDLLVVLLLAVEAASLARAEYRWVSYQWFLHHSAVFALYIILRASPDPHGRFPVAAGRLILAVAAVEVFVAFYQRFARGDFRPAGTLENPNLLAEILLYGAIAAFFALSFREGRGRAARWIPAALILLFLAGIGMTESRAGFLLVLAAGVFLLGRTAGWKWSVAGLVLAAAAVLVVPNPLLDRFRGIGDPYAFERVNMWKAAVRIFADHPAGVGVGHFKYYWHAARDPVEGTVIRYARYALTPHNEFLSVLSELGIAGAAAVIGLGAAFLACLGKAVRQSDPAAAAASAVLLVSGLHATVETNYHVIGLLLINASALAVVSGRVGRVLWEREVRIKGVVRWTGLTLLLAMTVYSGATLAGVVLESSGHAAVKAGRPKEAERRFLQAAATDPWRATSPDAASAARYALYEAGKNPTDLSTAIEWEREAVSRNPVDYVYAGRLGFLFARASGHGAGEWRRQVLEAGLASYDKALMLNPHSAEIRYQKAVLLRTAGRAGESRRLIEAMLADEPRYARGWVLLAELLEREDGATALQAYEKALSVHVRYGKTAGDPEEREFVSVDEKAVSRRIRELKERSTER